MARYREGLPQLGDELFLTDGGMETVMIFHEQIDLPHFAAIDLMRTNAGREKIRAYYVRYAAIAARYKRGFILESPTWRASMDWGAKLGCDKAELEALNKDAIALLADLRDVFPPQKPMVISGCIGPRGDGYDPGAIMSIKEAEAYHGFQAGIFATTQADMITGMTITNTPEAIGVARAASQAGMPVVISFTVETDGKLPTGQALGEAIMETDFESATAPAYYMINCAHPTHFSRVLEEDGPWLKRLKGLRANASKCSHAELDEAEVLDDGDPLELGRENAELRRLLPGLTVLGGCCGTDHRHVEAIAKAAA